ncbi:AMP-dependent synthetase and ligase [Rhodobacteraceae bacterium KLH11]|nr:AMP-dependent synthetase and ligase [Rhodobacteraceae bacterium KLH11]
MYSNSILDQIKADETLGAGNFLYKLRDIVGDVTEQSLFLDTAYVDHTGTARDSLSVEDILTLADGLANWYLEKGVSPKDPVALFFEDSVTYYIHFVALTSIGAIPTHLNPFLKLETAVEFIARTGACIAMVDDAHIALREQAAIPVFALDEIQIPSGDRKKPIYTHHNDDPVMLVHTSGTTGFPKAVRSDHLPMAYGVLKQLKGNVGTRILTALPHSHGSGMTILMSGLLRGAKMLVQTKKQPESMFAAIQKFQADMVIAFPKTFVDMCRFDLTKVDLNCVSYWLAIGDANHEAHVKKLVQFGTHVRKGIEHEGSVFIDNLGSSEISYAAFKKVHSLYETDYGRQVGTTFDWMDVAILDEGGNVLPENEVGYVGIKGPCLTKGYWNNTLLSEKNRLGGYWLSGDLAYKSSDGKYYHMDRVTDRVTTAEGPLYSCFTEELVLANFSDVFECSVVGIHSNDGRQKAVMAIELAKDATETIEKIGERINQLLEDRNVPKIAKFVADDPVNFVGVTGKRLKRVMREEITLDE